MARRVNVGETISITHVSQAGTNIAYRLVHLMGKLAYLGEEIRKGDETFGGAEVHKHSFLCLGAGESEIQFAYFRESGILYDQVLPVIIEEKTSSCGEFTKMRQITDEEKALFENVVCLMGAKYTPIVVAEQIVSGKNLRFFCLQEMATNPLAFNFVNVTIYVPLPGAGEPQLVSIADY